VGSRLPVPTIGLQQEKIAIGGISEPNVYLLPIGFVAWGRMELHHIWFVARNLCCCRYDDQNQIPIFDQNSLLQNKDWFHSFNFIHTIFGFLCIYRI
jgi:hypothetical protein